METKAKVLLAGAVLFVAAGMLIATGVVNAPNVPALHVVLPIGVILAGMFLVIRMFEQESRVAVEDQQHALAKAGKRVSADEVPAKQGAVLAK